jgi:hypothetical protein
VAQASASAEAAHTVGLESFESRGATLGRHDGVVQILPPDGVPATRVTFGRRVAGDKERTEKLLVVGSLRIERWVRFFC